MFLYLAVYKILQLLAGRRRRGEAAAREQLQWGRSLSRVSAFWVLAADWSVGSQQPRGASCGFQHECQQLRAGSPILFLQPPISLQNQGLSTLQVGFPEGLSGKESTCNSGDVGSVPGSGRSSAEGNGNPLQYSCLENPMDRGAWQDHSSWGHKALDVTG